MPQGPGFLVTFLYYFVSTLLIVDLAIAQQLHLTLTHPIPLQVGVAVGGLIGVLGGWFNHSVTHTLTLNNPRQFRQKLTETLAEIGFQATETQEDYQLYAPPGWRKWLTGVIWVKFEKRSVVMMGRSRLIRQMVRQLEQ